MSITVQQLFDEFVEGKEGAISRRNYRHRLRVFMKEFGDLEIAAITRTHVNRWRNHMLSLGHAQATNAGYKQAIRSFLQYAVNEGWLGSSPAGHIKVGSFHSESTKLPPEEDVIALYVTAVKLVASDSPRYRRIAAQFILSEESGGRLRSLRSVRLDEMNVALSRGPEVVHLKDDRTAQVYKVKTKGKTDKSKVTVLRFTEATVNAVRSWLEVRPDGPAELFCGVRKTKTRGDQARRHRGICESAFKKDMITLAQEAGISKAIQTHALRHRKGTQVVRAYDPKIASEILNHSGVDITLRMYYHPDESDINEAIAGTAIEAADSNRSFHLLMIFGFGTTSLYRSPVGRMSPKGSSFRLGCEMLDCCIARLFRKIAYRRIAKLSVTLHRMAVLALGLRLFIVVP